MMTSHPSPPAYDESAHLPVYDDVVINNRLQQVEKRLQKHIADVLKHNDVAVTEKAQKMVENILLIFEKRFDDLGEDVRKKMDAFKDWSTRLGTGEQTLIEMDKKIAKIHDKVTELDAFHAVIKRHEEREKKIHSDLLRRIRALEEREEKDHDVLIDEGIMRHIEKMVETRIGRAGAESGVDIDIDGLFDDSKLTPEDIEKIEVLKKGPIKIPLLNETQVKNIVDMIKPETIYIICSQFIITDKSIYCIDMTHTYTDYPNGAKHSLNFNILYTFNKKLSYSCIKFLNYFLNGPYIFEFGNNELIRKRINNYFTSHGFFVNVDAIKKFEQVIRLISGSYQNGDWVALGGFFGMYFNTKTLELSEGPPPMPI